MSALLSRHWTKHIMSVIEGENCRCRVITNIYSDFMLPYQLCGMKLKNEGATNNTTVGGPKHLDDHQDV
jgi:hypothetical protein